MTVFTIEIETIKDYLLKVNNVPKADDKIKYVIELFEYIQTANDLLATNPKFRRSVINKLEEFNTNEYVQKSQKMLVTIKATYDFLDNLKLSNNYILEDYEIPRKKINIII
jgi:hypothetical protein